MSCLACPILASGAQAIDAHIQRILGVALPSDSNCTSSAYVYQSCLCVLIDVNHERADVHVLPTGLGCMGA
jgi:hypothetical protein